MSSEPFADLVGIPPMAPPKAGPVHREDRAVGRQHVVGRNAAEEAIPIGCPTITKVVPPDLQAQRDADRKRVEQERQWRELLKAEGERNKTVVGRLFRKVTVSLVLVLAGLAALLLWTQVIQAIASIGSWSFWPWTFAMATFIAVAGLVAASIGRLIWFAVRFGRNRPVTRMLLEQREAIRAVAERFEEEARKQLGKYIEDYPLDDDAHIAFLRRWGLTDDDLNAMKRVGRDLLDGGNRKDSTTWQETFAIGYLRPLDRAADQIIHEYAVLTAVKTAICPYSLLDMSVVIYMETLMLGSLCKIYQLRAGSLDMIYIFGLVMSQAFFAGKAEEHSDEVATWIDGSVAGVLEHVGCAVPDLAANMFSKLAAKGSQGLANGLLLNRIGRQACQMLRPLN